MKAASLASSAALGTLIGCLAALATACAAHEPSSSAENVARFPRSGEREAWERMARPTPPLPAWALALVDTLPQTTAAQIDLDHLHRTASPLGPVLSARVRWAVADANRCDYSRAFAAADLERAAPGALAASEDGLTSPERTALEFARKLTLGASAITDAEAAELIEALGPDDAVALVHAVAHANFQDRIFLALGLATEAGGPLPPLAVGPTALANDAAPSRSAEVSASFASGGERAEALEWRERSVDDLRALLEDQKARQARIPAADAARLARLPRTDRERAGNSAWGRISMGYQPALTSAWYRTMRTFMAEAQLDVAFANTLFWVITRSTDCFY